MKPVGFQNEAGRPYGRWAVEFGLRHERAHPGRCLGLAVAGVIRPSAVYRTRGETVYMRASRRGAGSVSRSARPSRGWRGPGLGGEVDVLLDHAAEAGVANDGSVRAR